MIGWTKFHGTEILCIRTKSAYPSKMFSELRINPNDPDLDLFADGDLDGSEFTRATAKVWKTRDLPPVADFEKNFEHKYGRSVRSGSP